MQKYDKLNRQAKLVLADIFVAMEEKFIQFARVEDVLVIRPDTLAQTNICGIARYSDIQDRGFNKVLNNELDPYFKLLRENFTTDVLYKFITKTWDKESYCKDHAEIMTDKLIAKITSPDYVVPVVNKKKM